jgi:tetratricopeptide (TPR) repeat protein
MRLGLIYLVVLGCSAEHHADKGKAALSAHELAKAEGHYRSALSREPDHAPALAGLGWTYLLAGEIDAAAGAFERCQELHPSSTECLRGLASVASSRGTSPKARALLEQAIGIDPYDAGVLSSLALLDLSQGDYDKADTRYGQLVARFPAMAEYQLGMAEVRIRQDREVEAVAVIEAALALDDIPVRTRAMLHQTKARALVAATANRVDSTRCDQTAPQVRAWLIAADRAVADATATGVSMPDLPVVRRLLRRRHAAVESDCPQPLQE